MKMSRWGVVLGVWCVSLSVAGCSSEDETEEPTTVADSGNGGPDNGGAGEDATGGTPDAGGEADSERADLIQAFSNECLESCTQLAACDNETFPLGECEGDCGATTGEIVSEVPDDEAGIACITALVAQEACIGGLTCDEVDEWYNETTESYPCLSEETAVTVACGEL
jgi:hypothetical protein